MKITFQKLSVDAQVISPVSRKPDPNNEKLVKLLQGERLNDYIPSVENIPHVAMYLTLEASSDSERENVRVGIWNFVFRHFSAILQIISLKDI